MRFEIPKIWRRRIAVLVLIDCLIAAGIGAASAQVEAPKPEAIPFWDKVFWTYSAGFDFSRGDYGLDRDSTLYYVPIGVTADYEKIRLRLVVPFLVNDGPVRFAGGTVDAQGALESETNAGLGEATLAGSYLVAPLARGLPFVEIGAQVTAPTRTAKALGTGTWSFAARLDVFEKIGPVTPFASFGRSFFTSNSLEDRYFASVGASVSPLDSVSLGLSYDWLEHTNGSTPDAHEIVPFVSWKASPRWTVGPYGVIGLSNGSPDFGLGLSIRFAP